LAHETGRKNREVSVTGSATNDQLHFMRHWCLPFRHKQERHLSLKGMYIIIISSIRYLRKL